MTKAIEEKGFRDVMGHFATGVAVISGRTASGDYVGLTANSLTSVSLDPPLVLVCLDRNSASRPALLDSGRFGISFLAQDQEAVARRFARGARDTRFEDLEVREAEGGVPILARSLAWVICRVWRVVEAGDHSVLFGRVEATGSRTVDEAGEEEPLVFYRGTYGTVAR